MQAQAVDPSRSREIGKYHLVAELARGGMGIVHLASAQGPGGFSKLLVVKELKPELARDESYVSMFLDEARLAARLGHPNIVQTIEVGSEESRHYMVMEFLDGRSLHRVIRRFREQGGLPVGAHLRVVAEMLLGLHHAHELADFDGRPLGIVHRDVSPLNVFVTFDGQAKVLDFGIAKSADSSLETKTGILKGRVAYMAPEQAWGQGVDRRSDVYSAGVMIWEAAAGRRLWPGMNDVEILARLLREGPPRLCSVNPDAPEDLEAICARALEKRPEDRYSSAIELLEDLDAHIASRDDAVSIREVGAMVGRAFAEERRRMSALIEETLLRVRSGPRSGVMPTFEVHVRGTPSGASGVRDEASQVTGQLTGPTSSQSSSQVSASRLVMTPPLEPFLGAPLSPATASVTPAYATVEPPWWASRRAAFGAAGAGALLLASVVALLASGRDPEPATTTRAAVAAAAMLPERDTPELVDVLVRVTPANAQATLDGASIPLLPFHARYAKDSLVHHVTATADGYEPRTVDVTFVNDTSVDISLEKRPAAPTIRYLAQPSGPSHASKHASSSSSPSPPPSDPSPAPPPRVEVGPAGGHAPLRPISTSNPYGSQ